MKRGTTAQEYTTSHKNLTDTLDQIKANYLIVQNPPAYTGTRENPNFCEREVMKANAILSERHKSKFIECSAIEGDRWMIEGDGIHLTRGAAQIVAATVANAIINAGKGDQKDPEKVD